MYPYVMTKNYLYAYIYKLKAWPCAKNSKTNATTRGITKTTKTISKYSCRTILESTSHVMPNIKIQHCKIICFSPSPPAWSLSLIKYGLQIVNKVRVIIKCGHLILQGVPQEQVFWR